MLNKLETVLFEYRHRNLKDFLRFLLFKQYEKGTYFVNSLKSWYHKQLFIEQVTEVGKGLKMGSERNIIKRGDGADIIIGNEVTIYSPIHITATTHIYPQSYVKIGNRTRIGVDCAIRAAKGIEIGKDCLLARRVRIYDYNGHPLSPGSYDDIGTLRNRSATPPNEVSEILIGNNVWIGENAFIQRGVTIGTGSIVGANSVVIKDVPANTVVFGIPARVILWLDKPDENQRKGHNQNRPSSSLSSTHGS